MLLVDYGNESRTTTPQNYDTTGMDDDDTSQSPPQNHAIETINEASSSLNFPIPNHTCKGTSGVSSFLQSPTFIIAGVQKGGTTALRTFLKAHPQIYSSKPMNEGHFFDFARRKKPI